MSDVFADTHAVVWYPVDTSRLSAPALTALTAAEASGRIVISAITFVELTFLVEKAKIPQPVLDELWMVVRDPAEPVEASPLSLDVAERLHLIPRSVVPDMPDRIIAASALTAGLPLVSADQKIRSLSVPGLSVIW